MTSKTIELETVDLNRLPPLPESWCWCIPIDICSTIASGSTPKPDLMHAGNGDRPFIKVYNLTDRGVLDFSIKPTFIDESTHWGLLARSRVIPGDVLINIVGPPLGKVAIVPNDFTEWNINQAVVVFRPLDGILNKYLAFAFLTDSIMRRVTSLAKATAGQSNIGVGMCRRMLPIPLAPTNEQQRIVAKIEELFSDLDAGVAALKRAKANLKRYRAAVLKAAVEGKLTEEWRAKHPYTEPASKLLARILSERRQKWEADQLAKFAAAGKEPPKNWREKYVEPTPPDTSGLPGLPKAWCWASVEQLVAEEPNSLAIGPFGSNLKIADYREVGVPLVFVRNIRSTRFGTDFTKFVSKEKANELNSHSVEGGDILVTKMGEPPGDACLYPIDEPKAIITADCIKVRLHKLLEHSQYVVFAINSQVVRSQIDGITKGVAQQKVSLGRFSTIAIPLCPLLEQEQIVTDTNERLSLIMAAETAIERGLLRAARLRQSILQQAFEGSLVPQDPHDESASVLLGSIRHKNVKTTQGIG